MNRETENQDNPEDGSSNKIVEVFCDDCEAYCYEIVQPPTFPTNCVYDDALQQYKMMLQKVYMDLTSKDLMISELRDQLLQMESYCRKSLNEIQNLRVRYTSTVQELANLKKRYEMLNERKIEKTNLCEGALECLLKNEVQRWNQENTEIQGQIQSMNSDIQRLIRIVTDESKKTGEICPGTQMGPMEQLIANQATILTLLASKIEGNVKAIRSTNQCFDAICKDPMDGTDRPAEDLSENNATKNQENCISKETQTENFCEVVNSTEIFPNDLRVCANENCLAAGEKVEEGINSENAMKDETEKTELANTNDKNQLPLNENIVETKSFSPLAANRQCQPDEEENRTKKSQSLETTLKKNCYCGNTERCPQYTKKSVENETVAIGCGILNTTRTAEVTRNNAEIEQSILCSELANKPDNVVVEQVDTPQLHNDPEDEGIIETNNEETIVPKLFTPVFSARQPDAIETKMQSNNGEPPDTQVEETISVSQQVEKVASVSPIAVESENEVLDITFDDEPSTQVNNEPGDQVNSLSVNNFGSSVSEKDLSESPDTHLLQDNEIKSDANQDKSHEAQLQVEDEVPENLEENMTDAGRQNYSEEQSTDLGSKSSTPNEEIALETERKLFSREEIFDEVQPVKKHYLLQNTQNEKPPPTSENLGEAVVVEKPTLNSEHLGEAEVAAFREPEIPSYFEEFLSTVTNEIENINTLIAKNDSFLRNLKEDLQNIQQSVYRENAQLLEKIQSSLNNLPKSICDDSVFNEIKNNLSEVKQMVRNMQSLMDELNNKFKNIESLDNKEDNTKENMKPSEQKRDDTEIQILNELLDKVKNLEKNTCQCSKTDNEVKPIKSQITTKCNKCKNKKATETARKNNVSTKQIEGTQP